MGGSEFSQLLTGDVMNVLASGVTRPIVRKKAALCLLRLLRKAPPDAEIMQPDVWGVQLATMLEDRDLGVLLGLSTLLLGLASRSYEGGWRRERQCATSIQRLSRVNVRSFGIKGSHCMTTPACRLPPNIIIAGYEACVPRIVRVLERCKQRDVSQV